MAAFCKLVESAFTAWGQVAQGVGTWKSTVRVLVEGCKRGRDAKKILEEEAAWAHSARWYAAKRKYHVPITEPRVNLLRLGGLANEQRAGIRAGRPVRFQLERRADRTLAHQCTCRCWRHHSL